MEMFMPLIWNTAIGCSIYVAWFIIIKLGIIEMIEFYGPLLWGFWGEIWESEDYTIFAKVIFISGGVILYLLVMFISLRWLKSLFFKKVKNDYKNRN